jgi:RNA polymerase sigma-70 factor (ECF subfamily)
LEEAALIQALKEGRPDAFRMLVTEQGDRVYNTVLSMVQHPEDAEDVVQDVFVSVYQHVGRFRGDAKLSTWIYRIAVTKSLEALRRSSRKQGRMTESLSDETGRIPAASFHHPGVQIENRERAAVLFRAMSLLPEKQKTAFVLHKAEGLSYAEIADVMELTLPSVESLIYRARQGLQKLLANYYHET